MSNNIVQVQVTQTIAPAPSILQRTGAFVTAGGTNGAVGSLTLLTQLSDLTPILDSVNVINAIIWNTGLVTVTSAQPHGITVGDTKRFTITGMAPTGYNGTFVATATGLTTFTYPVVVNPGASTVIGTWFFVDVTELTQMATTFFSQGNGVGVYVLELGPVSATAGVAILDTWLTANPDTVYSLLLPRSYVDSTPGLFSLIARFEATTAKLNFFLTASLGSFANFSNLMSCVFLTVEAPALGAYGSNSLTSITWQNGISTAITTLGHGVTPGQWITISGAAPGGYNGNFLTLPGTNVQTLVWAQPNNPGVMTTPGTLVGSAFSAPGIPAGEFTAAAAFYVTLNYQPSSTNLVTPTAFSYLSGVTPFPTRGRASLMATLKAANVNWVGTGAEGGISNTILFWGTMLDGRDFTYWYSVDWVQINVEIDIANEIINGSNNPLAPLYYDQNGINRLKARAQGTMSRGVSYGLVLPPVIVNAVAFADYVRVNISDYPKGIYNGLSVVYTPNRGFKAILFNVNVTDFPAA